MSFKLRTCKKSGLQWKQYNSLQKCPCEECKKETPKKQFVSKHKPNLKLKSFKPIPKVSAKRKIENLKYSALRIEFLGKKENKICPITKQPTTEVHHTYCGKDRAKYYLDVSTWLAVSRKGHNWIHDNPKEARELGFLK
jgi:hypothetical protein